MAYSIVGILAVAVLLIVNVDVFLDLKNRTKFRGERWYLAFLGSVIVYCITDGFWGILYEAKLTTSVFADTTVYFFAMATSILLWGSFVYRYLGVKHKAGLVIPIAGIVIFLLQSAAIIVNFFTPILFTVSPECVYEACWFRYVILGTQILVFLLVSIYAFVSAIRERESARRRMVTIALLSLFMAVAITLQTIFPLMPMYAMGYLFGVCLLHTFVIRNEMVNRLQELDQTKHRISVDPLTGAYSKYAYIDAEVRIDNEVGAKSIESFSVIIFDINDLKKINDTYGHKEGDKYIKECANLIFEYFQNIPVYRVGGDEFAAILLGENYENGESLLRDFEIRIDKNRSENNRIVIASGKADYDPERDTAFLQVFARADRKMYARKERLKQN